jgi:hypothetical protein
MAHKFKLNPEVSDTNFLSASNKMQDEFYEQYDSFKRRELLKGNDNTWTEILHWSGDGPAKHIQEAFKDSEICMVFMGMIKLDSIKALDLNQVRDLHGSL